MSVYGVDTRGTFIGHAPKLREAIDFEVAVKFGDLDWDSEIPASLEYLFTQMLIESLYTWTDIRDDDYAHVAAVYAAIDDTVLRHAINAGHVKSLKIDRYGYYVANGDK